MILLRDGSVVLLSCETEIAASYKQHRPVPGQFTVSQPYQAPATQATDTPDDVRADVASDDKDLVDVLEVEAAPANVAATSSLQRPDAAAPLAHRPDGAPHNNLPAPRQRKRKRKQREYQSNAQAGTMCTLVEPVHIASSSSTIQCLQSLLFRHGLCTPAGTITTTHCRHDVGA